MPLALSIAPREAFSGWGSAHMMTKKQKMQQRIGTNSIHRSSDA